MATLRFGIDLIWEWQSEEIVLAIPEGEFPGQVKVSDWLLELVHRHHLEILRDLPL